MPLYLSQHRVRYTSLTPPADKWRPKDLFNLQARIQRNLKEHKMHAVQVGQTWNRRCLPVISLDSDRLIIGAGGDVLVHPLVPPSSTSSYSPATSPQFPPLRSLPPSPTHRKKGRRDRTTYAPKAVASAHVYPLSNRSDSDIVGLHPLPSGEVIAAQFDGTLQRFNLSGQLRSTAHYQHPKEHIYALSGYDDHFLALSYGIGSLYSARSPWLPPIEFEFEERPWSGLLTSDRAFIGIRGEVAIFNLRPDGVEYAQSLRADGSSTPGTESDDGVIVIDSLDALDSALGRTARRSTPYSIALGNDPYTVLSAWHDGFARLHDLRTGSCEMELSDPWQDAPLYCASFLGENSVATGGSQHGIVSVFDIRTAKGYSVFTPEGKGSPVYGMVAEGGRVWGVSERRAFVCAWDESGDARGGLKAQDDLHEVYEEPNGHYGCGRGRGGGRARGRGRDGKDIPTGYRRRGGKWGWTVGYGEHAKETCMGYRHEDNGTTLFETKVPV